MQRNKLEKKYLLAIGTDEKFERYTGERSHNG